MKGTHGFVLVPLVLAALVVMSVAAVGLTLSVKTIQERQQVTTEATDPGSCSGYTTPGSCDAVTGCDWQPCTDCRQVPVSQCSSTFGCATNTYQCSGLSQAECNTADGCNWQDPQYASCQLNASGFGCNYADCTYTAPTGGSCTGSYTSEWCQGASGCSLLDNKPECQLNGCTWQVSTFSCSGFQTSSSCNNQSGCQWTGGTPASCSGSHQTYPGMCLGGSTPRCDNANACAGITQPYCDGTPLINQCEDQPYHDCTSTSLCQANGGTTTTHACSSGVCCNWGAPAPTLPPPIPTTTPGPSPTSAGNQNACRYCTGVNTPQANCATNPSNACNPDMNECETRNDCGYIAPPTPTQAPCENQPAHACMNLALCEIEGGVPATQYACSTGSCCDLSGPVSTPTLSPPTPTPTTGPSPTPAGNTSACRYCTNINTPQANCATNPSNACNPDMNECTTNSQCRDDQLCTAHFNHQCVSENLCLANDGVLVPQLLCTSGSCCNFTIPPTPTPTDVPEYTNLCNLCINEGTPQGYCQAQPAPCIPGGCSGNSECQQNQVGCPQGFSYCEGNVLHYCRSDQSGYDQVTCSGDRAYCDAALRQCVVGPSPTPVPQDYCASPAASCFAYESKLCTDSQGRTGVQMCTYSRCSITPPFTCSGEASCSECNVLEEMECREQCVALGNTAQECGNLPPCPELLVPTLNECTSLSAGDLCLVEGVTPGRCQGSSTNLTCTAIIEKPVGSSCVDDFDCESFNCLPAPGGLNLCAPTGAPAQVPVGGECGTKSWNHFCAAGAVCEDNQCEQPLETKAWGGESCTQDDQCMSGMCLPNNVCDGPARPIDAYGNDLTADAPDYTFSDDPLMNATMEVERRAAIDRCVASGGTQSACETEIDQLLTTAYNYPTQGVLNVNTCMAYYLMLDPTLDPATLHDRCASEISWGIAVVGGAATAPFWGPTALTAGASVWGGMGAGITTAAQYIAAYGYAAFAALPPAVQTALSYGGILLSVADIVDTVLSCSPQVGDPFACQLATGPLGFGSFSNDVTTRSGFRYTLTDPIGHGVEGTVWGTTDSNIVVKIFDGEFDLPFYETVFGSRGIGGIPIVQGFDPLEGVAGFAMDRYDLGSVNSQLADEILEAVRQFHNVTGLPYGDIITISPDGKLVANLLNVGVDKATGEVILFADPRRDIGIVTTAQEEYELLAELLEEYVTESARLAEEMELLESLRKIFGDDIDSMRWRPPGDYSPPDHLRDAYDRLFNNSNQSQPNSISDLDDEF